MTTESSPRSKETVTDRLVRQAKHKMLRRLEESYERTFPYLPAPPGFFEYLSRWEDKVEQDLAARPLTKAEINALEARAWKALRLKLQGAAEQVKQPRMQEQVHIDTGATKLIPYVD